MDQITLHGEDQEKADGSTDGQGEEIAEGEPLESGDLTAGGGKRRADPDGAEEGRRGVPSKNEDERSGEATDGEGMGLDGGEESGVREPALLLAGADLLELVAGDASDLSKMRSP